jgi:hypothetical protein
MVNPLATIKNYTSSTRVRVFIISLTVLVAPLFIYFSLHVTNRTRYFNDRNFRQLGNFSHQISERIDNLGTAFNNAVDRFLEPPADQPPSEKNRDEFQKYLDVLKSDGTVFSAGQITPSNAVGKKKDFTVTIDVTNQDSTTWLTFEGDGKLKEWPELKASARTDFQNLIVPILSKREEGQSKADVQEDFDHVVIARADNGKTLFQVTNGDLNLTSLEHVHLADAPDKTLDLKTRSQTTDSVDVTIAGARYKLYVQPIEISLPTKAGKDPKTLWVICGLVDASRFRYQTWAISYTVLIFSGFVAGLLLLSWFFLKLFFIGPKDRLRPAETHVLAVSIVVAGFLLTMFVLFGLSYTNTEKMLDGQLQTLASTFKEHFKTEIGAALDQIEKLEDKRSELIEKKAEHISRTDVLKDICKDGNCDLKQNPYPYFKSVFWVDDEGEQVAKWSTYSQTTKFINVGRRKYFRSIRDGYAPELNGKRFGLESVVSQNTGGFTVAISKATKTEGDPKASVVVLNTSLMSLMKPVIVGGFGYRVINSDGEVIVPNLKENFFKECDQDVRLLSAVSGHLIDTINAPYMGRDTRIHVTPIPGTPDWTLVVFRDKEPLRSEYLELVCLSTSLFVIYLATFLLMLTLIYLAAPVTRPARKWLWPSEKSSAIYLQSIPASILLCVFASWLSSRLPDYALVVVFSLLSMAAVLLLSVQLKHNLLIPQVEGFAKFLQSLWSRIDYRFLYTFCLVPLVFLLAVLPSIAFFRLAYNDEMDLFTKYGQVTFVNSLNEREARARAFFSRTLFGSGNKKATDNFLRTRADAAFDRYDGFFFDTQILNKDSIVTTRPEETGQGRLLFILRRLFPFASQNSIIRHGLVENRSADDFWRWSRIEGGKLLLQVPNESPRDKSDASLLKVASNTPHFWLRRFSWFCFVSLMVFVLFLLIRFVVKRVFLLDAVKLSHSHDKPSVLSDAGHRFVVLGSPYTRRSQIAPAAQYKVLNLETAAVNSEWAQKLNLKTLKDAPAIAVDCFEYQIDQPQQNLQKLTLLEKLLTHNRKLLVSSTADPGDYLFETPEKDSKDRRITEASARWAGLMSNFRVQYLEDDGNAGTFHETLKKIRNGENHNGANGNNGNNGNHPAIVISDPAEEKLYKLLTDECAPRACLQDIGAGIARRIDFKKIRRDELIEEVLVQATTYYKFVWKSCLPHEKLTLAHLALDGFVSPNDPDLPKLVRRGLIVLKPEVRLLNESFRLFVLVQSRNDEEVVRTEGEARSSSSWQYLKVALSVPVVVVMFFLFATQRDLYNSMLVALTSIVGGLPVVFNFFNLFQKNPASRPPSA